MGKPLVWPTTKNAHRTGVCAVLKMIFMNICERIPWLGYVGKTCATMVGTSQQKNTFVGHFQSCGKALKHSCVTALKDTFGRLSSDTLLQTIYVRNPCRRLLRDTVRCTSARNCSCTSLSDTLARNSDEPLIVIGILLVNSCIPYKQGHSLSRIISALVAQNDTFHATFCLPNTAPPSYFSQVLFYKQGFTQELAT